MREPTLTFADDLRSRVVILETVNNQLRWRAPRGITTNEDKQRLADNAPIIMSILNPDLTLPDVLVIPANVPNDVEAIAACIDSQRIRRAA